LGSKAFRALRLFALFSTVRADNKKGPFRDPVKRQRQEIRVSPGLLLALQLQ
jgi:hypothetical protein